MKRIMVSAAVAAITFSVLLSVVNNLYALIPAGILLALSLILTVFASRRILYYIFPALIVIAFMSAQYLLINNSAHQLSAYNNEFVLLNGTVVSCGSSENSAVYTFKTECVNGIRLPSKIKLYSSFGLMYKMGDKVTLKAKMFSDKSIINSYAYGTICNGRIVKEVSVDGKNLVYSTAGNIRQAVANTVFRYFGGDCAAALTGLTIGDKESISDTFAQNIKRAGVSHVMVVSGMHLAIITSFFTLLIEKMKIGKRTGAAGGILLVLIMAAVTGFTPSALRSSVTFIIMFFATLTGRKADALNSLCTAVCLILTVNPFAVFNVSFLLSATATLGVLVVSPAIKTLICGEKDGVVGALAGVISTTLSAVILTTPVTVWYFGTVSAVAVITNLLITYPVTLTLVLTVLAVLLSPLPFLCKPILVAAGVLSRFIVTVINGVGSLPFAIIKIKNVTFCTVIFAVFALAVTVFCFIKTENEPRRLKFGNDI